MNANVITGLFDLANRAKNARQYPIANAIFAVLAEGMFESVFNDGDSSISVEWETNDPEGESVSEAYNDLAVLVYGDGLRLNIPVPLLTSEAVVTLMKVATVVPRREHGDRPFVEAASADLVKEAGELVGLFALNTVSLVFLRETPYFVGDDADDEWNNWDGLPDLSDEELLGL